MTHEKSCGTVVFTRIDGEIKYVLAQSVGGHFGFPKGHVEPGETEEETALREVAEEVGLRPVLLNGFREVSEYLLPGTEIHKQAVFFLGEYAGQPIVMQEAELKSAPLVTYEEGLALLTHEDNRRILMAAHARLKAEPIKLNPLSDEDKEQVISILTDDTVKKTYMLPDFPSRTEAEGLFCRLMELSRQEGRYVRGIYLGETLIGFLNDVEINGDSVELGWVIHPDYHNKGYATRAVTWAVEELFALGYAEVTAGAFAENPASIRVMEKCGMTLLDRTEEIEYRGTVHRCVYYAIRRSL